MRSGVIAKKIGMTRVFNEGGQHIPVTRTTSSSTFTSEDVEYVPELCPF